jgi:hypothetical protein
LPMRLGNSPWPPNTCTPGGWLAKCGWCASTSPGWTRRSSSQSARRPGRAGRTRRAPGLWPPYRPPLQRHCLGQPARLPVDRVCLARHLGGAAAAARLRLVRHRAAAGVRHRTDLTPGGAQAALSRHPRPSNPCRAGGCQASTDPRTPQKAPPWPTKASTPTTASCSRASST